MKIKPFKNIINSEAGFLKKEISLYALIILLFFSSFIIPDNEKIKSKYKDIFKEDYSDALNYFKENYLLFHKIFKQNDVDEDILIPVVFPERIRYSVIRNYLETETMKILYKKYGSDAVDFSIGDLQMKPSFAENIENIILNNSVFKEKYAILIIKKENRESEREERIRRLELLPYQIFYLSVFYEIVYQKFTIADYTKEDKIKFIASAYNHGFESSKKRIEEHIDVEFFPYGKKYPGKQYAYTDVSVDFYKNYYLEIAKKY